MPSNTRVRAQIVGTLNPMGGVSMREDFLEAASQDFKKGDLLYMVAGYATELTDNQATDILGVALADASGTTGTKIPVEVIRPDSLVLMELTDGGASYAYTSSQADVGADFGIDIRIVSSVPYWYVNNAESGATQVVRVYKHHPDSGATDNNPWVLVTFKPAVLYVSSIA